MLHLIDNIISFSGNKIARQIESISKKNPNDPRIKVLKTKLAHKDSNTILRANKTQNDIDNNKSIFDNIQDPNKNYVWAETLSDGGVLEAPYFKARSGDYGFPTAITPEAQQYISKLENYHKQFPNSPQHSRDGSSKAKRVFMEEGSKFPRMIRHNQDYYMRSVFKPGTKAYAIITRKPTKAQRTEAYQKNVENAEKRREHNAITQAKFERDAEKNKELIAKGYI